MNLVDGFALPQDFFHGRVDEVAEKLVGMLFLVNGVGGVIVETEAYDQDDPASHCYKGRRTPLNEAMFLAGGHAYVCPGRHMFHLNFVCGPAGFGSAVLIRALRPQPASIDVMKQRRDLYQKIPPKDSRYLCSGPGKLCEALGIGCKHNGTSLYDAPFCFGPRSEEVRIVQGKRINTPAAPDRLRRYGLLETPSFLSVAMPCPPAVPINFRRSSS